MKKLRRAHLESAFTEASALLPVQSAELLSRLGAEQAWWIVHDEADLTNMVSIVCKAEVGALNAEARWSIAPVTISAPDQTSAVTDAEALAYADGMVFVVGSGFVDRRGRLDSRRSFIARFAEAEVEIATRETSSGEVTITASAEVLALDTDLVRRLNIALDESDIEVMKLRRRAAKRLAKSSGRGGGRAKNSSLPDGQLHPRGNELPEGSHPMNIEGAAILGDDLVLGLRWPVSRSGQPLVAVLRGGRGALVAEKWSSDALLNCPISIRVIEQAGSSKRPTGIRAMSGVDDQLHVVCGPTDRDLAATKVRAAKLQHLEVDLAESTATELRSFEGFRKVEALAPMRGTSQWLYALDDEDAIVLLETTEKDD